MLGHGECNSYYYSVAIRERNLIFDRKMFNLSIFPGVHGSLIMTQGHLNLNFELRYTLSENKCNFKQEIYQSCLSAASKSYRPLPWHGQTDRQTDRSRRLRAHRAWAQVGSKTCISFEEECTCSLVRHSLNFSHWKCISNISNDTSITFSDIRRLNKSRNCVTFT